MPETPEGHAILAAMLPVAEAISHLPLDGRITLLCGLLAQEVCTLPNAERRDELQRIIAELPDILDATEQGMRDALVANARDGL